MSRYILLHCFLIHHFRTIPRRLRIMLSLVPPERLQVSYVSGSNIDITQYVFFRLLNLHQVARINPYYASRLRSLCRMNKLGLYFGTEKHRGDTPMLWSIGILYIVSRQSLQGPGRITYCGSVAGKIQPEGLGITHRGPPNWRPGTESSRSAIVRARPRFG